MKKITSIAMSAPAGSLHEEAVVVAFGSGFVVIALESGRDDTYAYLARCATIRRWDTDRGLGQLRRPRPGTVLDGEPGELRVPLTAIWKIATVDRDAWLAVVDTAIAHTIAGIE
jgi:hypothetical protein